jgi:phosphopantothenoylcysteine decarboxylase / phosphopantothenate---cysteine ligase
MAKRAKPIENGDPSNRLTGRRILLVITGGIAAYKSLDLIRRIAERGGATRAILTRAAAEFVTPMTVAAISGEKAYCDLFSLTDESEMGHLKLAQDADLVVVAPATADIMARMAAGLADDLATTALLATDRPILIAPAMNHRMWRHPATQRNLAELEGRGVRRIGPNDGPLAERESGPGRMAEPIEIVAAMEQMLLAGPLAGRRAIVTSGPTHEPIDPVRFISNRSSGKQGHAIAAALAGLGAETTLVSGPTHEPFPPGVRIVAVETAEDMLAAVQNSLPADVIVCAAAVADWRVARPSRAKIKKRAGAPPPELALALNPDILATVSKPSRGRPRLVIGFAAETENIVAAAREKRKRKGCDWILANDVSPGTGAFGGDSNKMVLLTGEGEETWPRLSKREIGLRLAAKIAQFLTEKTSK